MSNGLAVVGPKALEAAHYKGQTEFEGFYHGMPFEVYAAVPALNGSKILEMRRSPMQYKHALDNPKPETEAMFLGTVTHRMVLEPEKVGEIAVWGTEPTQKVRNGGVWNKFQADNEGKTILTAKEFMSAINMSTHALKNAPIRHYAYASGKTEVSIFWKHPITKRRFKARLDKILSEEHCIFDLKTCRDCHSWKFGSQSYALGYHIKAALYSQGYEILTGHKPSFRIGAMESKAPHESAVYRVTEDVIKQGWDELDHLVGRITACEKSGKWPAEHEQETDLLLPAWSQYSDMDQYDDVVA